MPPKSRALRARRPLRLAGPFFLVGVASALGGCIIGGGTEGTPVRFESGAPLPIRFFPGVVEHEVCVATDVAEGYIRAVKLIGVPDVEFIGPTEGAPIQTLPLSGLECPPASDGWAGWARFHWETREGRNLVTFQHEAGPVPTVPDESGGGDEEFLQAPAPRGDDPLMATTGELVLSGERFPGYEIVDAFVDDSQPGLLGISLDLGYGAAGVLDAQPASDVPFVLTYTPVDMPVFGSSSGDDLQTDRDGHADVLYSLSTFCDSAFDPGSGDPTNVTVFVTPQAGGTDLGATLEYDSYCGF